MFESANSLSQPLRGMPAMVGGSLAFAFGFVGRNPGAILRSVAIPGLLGCLSLYVLVWGYCTQLTDYLGFPSEGLASRILGIAAVGVLIMLLLHAIVISRLADLITGSKSYEPGFLGIRPDSWRIYAANLRLLLGLGLYGLAIFGASKLMARFGIAPDIATAFNIVALLLLFWFAARCWFFLLPVSLQAKKESVLEEAWRDSKGFMPAIGGILLTILATTLTLLKAGEFVFRFFGIFPPVPAGLALANAIALYQSTLWPFVILVSVVYLFGVSLMTAARLRLYEGVAASPT